MPVFGLYRLFQKWKVRRFEFEFESKHYKELIIDYWILSKYRFSLLTGNVENDKFEELTIDCWNLKIPVRIYRTVANNQNNNFQTLKRASLHNGFWFWKFAIISGLFIGLYTGIAMNGPEQSFLTIWKWIALFFGSIFIFWQMTVFVNFAYDWGKSWGQAAERSETNCGTFGWKFAIWSFSFFLMVWVKIKMTFFDLSKCLKRRNFRFLANAIFHSSAGGWSLWWP